MHPTECAKSVGIVVLEEEDRAAPDTVDTVLAGCTRDCNVSAKALRSESGEC